MHVHCQIVHSPISSPDRMLIGAYCAFQPNSRERVTPSYLIGAALESASPSLRSVRRHA